MRRLWNAFLTGLGIGAFASQPCAQTIPADGYVMIPMRDGVRLHSRVSLPPTGSGPWPAALTRTPYPDDNLNWTKLPDMPSMGYALIAQHTRGRYGSEGSDAGSFHNDAWGELEDAYDTCAWIAAQPWCNGRIGTFGGSGRGAFINLAAGATPPGLQVEWIIASVCDLYNGALYHGGVPRKSLLTDWYQYLGAGLMDTALAHPVYDQYWMDVDMRTQQSARNHPVCITTGWYDVFQQSALDNFTTIMRDGGPKAKAASKLVILLSVHGTNAGALPFPANATAFDQRYGSKYLFAQYLKDEDHAWESLPPVNYYLIGDLENPGGLGNDWHYAETWPVPRRDTAFYLHSDGTLSTRLPGDGDAPKTFSFNPNDPVPTIGGATLTPPIGNLEQSSVEQRPDVLLFETPPLQEPLTITGRIWVNVWVSTSAVDTDFTAKLTDVYPDGKSIVCNDGIRRMRYRESYQSTELVKRGATYRIAIDLNAMGMVFNRGHRLRVAISSSNAPRFLPNSNTGAAPRLNDPVKIVAQNTVYFDTARPSHIVLPLVGPDRDADGVYDYFDPAPDNSAAPGAMPDEVTYVHSADTNADRRLNLSEILRIVQFFNSGAYHCDAASSDGFAPGPGPQNCRAYDSDFNPQDFQIALNELLQAIQLFNSKGFAAVPEFTPPFVPADATYALLSPTEP